jgi:DNA-binding LacI/PurR family transcriptional regulator
MGELAEEIKKLAVHRGPLAKMPTKRQLCEMLGASSATVHGALKLLEDSKVLDMRQGSGIYVSSRIHRKTIAIVFNALLLGANASPFGGMLLSQFAEVAAEREREAGQDFAFFITSPTAEPDGQLPDHLTRAVRAGAVSGIAGISLSVGSGRWFLDQGIPYTAYAGWSKWTVVTAGKDFVQAGLKALASQGCRRVEYWGLPRPKAGEEEWYAQMRRDVEAAFHTVGLEPPKAFVGPEPDLLARAGFTDGDEPHSYRAYVAARALFGDPDRPKPDGLFLGDDSMANGVLLALQELGVRVGRDVKIVSQANRTSLILFGVQQHLITLLEFDPAEITGSLIRLLDDVMANPALPETEISVPWRIRLPDAA